MRTRAHPPVKSFADALKATAVVGRAAQLMDEEAQAALSRHSIASAALGLALTPFFRSRDLSKYRCACASGIFV